MSEDEAEPQKKKKRRRSPVRHKPVNTKATASDHLPKGAPIDAHGNPIPNAEIRPEDIDRFAFDAEGARAMQEHHDVMRRKNSGEQGVRWHGDSRWRFKEAKDWKPHATVSFVQLEPFKAENFPSKPIAFFRDYQALIDYLRVNHWQGGRAAYQWNIGDDQIPTWARGTIYFDGASEEMFAEDDEMKKGQQQPPGWPGYPPQQQSGWPGYPQQPPGWPGYPPPPWGYPMPQVPMPQQPPPAPVQAPGPQSVGAAPYPMPPPGTDPAIVGMMRDMMGVLMQQAQQGQANQPQMAQMSQMLSYLGHWLQQQQTQQPQQPPTPPTAPKSVLEQLSEMANAVRQVNQVRSALVNELQPGSGGEGETNDNPVKGDEDFPLKFKQVGPVRYMSGPDGEVSAPLLANIDNVSGAAEAFFTRAEKFVKSVSEAKMSGHREQVELMERANKAQRDRITLDVYTKQLMHANAAPAPAPAPAPTSHTMQPAMPVPARAPVPVRAISVSELFSEPVAPAPQRQHDAEIVTAEPEPSENGTENTEGDDGSFAHPA